ncbi:MAG: lytic transglycosylase domain-containing protein [Petrimonas sp.]|nr:lytic transglycosylase domain-containing protein [Petrimonas sp.]
MKKNLLYITLPVPLITVVLLLLSNIKTDNEEKTRPMVLSMTASVDPPEKMVFAGENVTFDRYDLHERMDRELNSFTYFHSTTLLLFKRANRIFPIIEPILKRNGLPEDIKYLAVIESSLDPQAISPARAVGLWQFMEGTAKGFGLEVSSDVDERYNIEKSTVAACRYLKDAYQKYGSWAAAAMSYNGGQGRISNELRDQRVDDALDLWLVQETSRYYFRMLAIKLIFEYPRRYGFVIRPDQLYKPLDYKEITTSSAIPDLASYARQHGITYAILKDNNAWIRGDALVNRAGKSYTILIPTKESMYYRKGEKIKVHDTTWVTSQN